MINDNMGKRFLRINHHKNVMVACKHGEIWRQTFGFAMLCSTYTVQACMPRSFRLAAGLALGPIISIWTNKYLIYRLAQREIQARYRGTLLGVAWSALIPIVMLAIYTVVFTKVFQTRWDTSLSGHPIGFALSLFVGLSVFNMFSEVAGRGPGLIRENPTYVKKMAFPLDILAWVSVAGSLFSLVTSLGIVVIVNLIVNNQISGTILATPLIILPLCLFLAGVGWLLSTVSVYYPDFTQIVPPIISVTMFTTPIFYPISAVPSEYLWIVKANPLSDIIDGLRMTLLYGKLPATSFFLAVWISSALVSVLGFIAFQLSKEDYADVV